MKTFVKLFGGLSIWNPRREGSLRAALVAALAVAALVALCDSFIFRAFLTPDNAAYMRGPGLLPRMSLLSLTWVFTDVEFRLVVMSVLVAIYYLAWGSRHLKTMDWGALTAAMVAQGLFLYLNPPVAAYNHPVYELVRFFTPGVVWGWLYWRYSFMTAIAADWASTLLSTLLLYGLLRS
jgi:hypothetical protein